MLVLSKVDLVTKGAIVRLLAQRTHVASPPAGPCTDEGGPRPRRGAITMLGVRDSNVYSENHA
jgi:hypothetical protein